MVMSDAKAWARFEDYLINEGLTKTRIEKHKYFHKLYKHLIKKPLMEVKEDDLRAMVRKLSLDELKGINGRKLGGWTKSDVKKHIKKFYRVLLTDGEYNPPLTRWIKTLIPKDEKPKDKEIISKEEAVKVAALFKKPNFKLLVLIAFDSGFRINELLTMRRNDLEFRKAEKDGACFWVHCRESKTRTRTIDIGLFTKEIKELLDTSYYKNVKEQDLLFNISYNSFRMHLKARCLKSLGKVITPHSFRHSSATLYAGLLEGNLIAICDRYGWEYDSPQPRIYIRRSGVMNKFSAKKVYNTNLSKLEESQKQLLKIVMKHLKNKDKIKPEDWDELNSIYASL